MAGKGGIAPRLRSCQALGHTRLQVERIVRVFPCAGVDWLNKNSKLLVQELMTRTETMLKGDLGAPRSETVKKGCLALSITLDLETIPHLSGRQVRKGHLGNRRNVVINWQLLLDLVRMRTLRPSALCLDYFRTLFLSMTSIEMVEI